jgi:VanZ family protein
MARLFKIIFWLGYTAVLLTSFAHIPWALDKMRIGVPHFRIRLDHLLHMCVYFLICMYYFAGQSKGLTLFRANRLRSFVVAVLVLATVSELVQWWVPSRSFNPMDWVANVTGMAIGLGVGRLAFKKKDTTNI